VNWLVKDDLSELKKLPSSWTALNRLIREEHFPPGRIAGRNRIWLEQEVDEWLLSRSTDKAFLRGRAKQLIAEARPPEISKPGPSVDAEGTGPNQAIQLAPPSIPDSAPATQDLEEVLR
jgi:predicted DNA-binding transcriptional regulator AlpA